MRHFCLTGPPLVYAQFSSNLSSVKYKINSELDPSLLYMFPFTPSIIFVKI